MLQRLALSILTTATLIYAQPTLAKQNHVGIQSTIQPSPILLARSRTVPFILRQGLGCSSTCKAIVVSQETGNRYVVEYGGRLNTNNGSEVLVEVDSYNYWQRIINPVNGTSQPVYSVKRA